jgi:hypothetical protein
MAGGTWPERARQAALQLSAFQETSFIGSLLLDISLVFASTRADQLFTRDLLAELNARRRSAWAESLKSKEATELWLSRQLRPLGIRSRNMSIAGFQAKGYDQADFMDVFCRYISKTELKGLKDELGTDDPDADAGSAAR